MNKLPSLLSRNSEIVDPDERPWRLPTFTYPICGASQADLEITKIQSDTMLRLASMNSHTELSLARIRQDTLETITLISSTSNAMEKALDMYRDDPMPRDMKCAVKTKLSGLFGKSCMMTVEVQRSGDYRDHYYLRGPVK